MDSFVAEINLLGTGGGYGESVVIHLGNHEWIVVDSCQDPNTKESLPLVFLKSRLIDLNQVKLIVCTHWHDDHIKGISTLLRNCPNAVFSFARANDQKKFLQFVSLDYEKVKSITSNSATIEFNQCLELLRERQAKYSSADRLLYGTKFHDFSIDVFSLSPSDFSSELFDHEISRLISDFGAPNKKLPKQTPNDRSVVLLLKLGKQTVLLGADLEVHDNPKLGWLDITRNSQVVKGSTKSKYFKIPHHGSETGYHREIWDSMLTGKPLGTLTPWNRNNKLPTNKMVIKYGSLTSKLFITSPLTVSSKPKRRDRKTMKIIKEFNKSVRELKFQYGVITSKVDITSEHSKWSTSLSGTSHKLN